jgi:4-hydroxybutyrate CoA-transferase
MKITTSEQAVKAIKSGDRVFVHSAAASPQQLVQAMTDRAHLNCVRSK